ncbi:LacI family DNA-binding transcriptional regulator [Aerococcus sp. Group 2]|uniref:LacI family DNA-binding transcriptional regulator n=1 Tax=Aerococcus sp. Group 2 TaxID=2976811 RepID=UPI0018A79989|nr:LacI family DNA-binding transcriptional regulator [Aerococcus sp. Group 2]
MAITLADVAKKAEVSATTVSRVINNYGYLSEKTIKKVRQAMEELNYQPNALARSLQGKGTQLIGLIFPSVAHPFYGELVEALESCFFEEGYYTILCNSANNKEKERHYLRMLAANQVDGIVAGAHNMGIEEYHHYQKQVVSFDRYLSEEIPIVGSDNFQGGQMATEMLALRGAKRIGIFTGSQKSASPTNQRLEGYLSVIEAQKLNPYVYQLQEQRSSKIAAQHIQSILKKDQLDGIFCTDDLTALLTLDAAKDLGLQVPHDLKIIGYDGSRFIQNYHPELSTIVQPIQDYANLIADLLIKKIKQPDSDLNRNYQLPVSFLQGKTC